MRNKLLIFLSVLLLAGVYGCRPLKHLPDNTYLVSKNKVKTSDNAFVGDLGSLIKQKPNTKTLGIIRLRMGVYMYADRQTPGKFNNWLKSAIGEEPVLFDPIQAEKSRKQMRQLLVNKGYFDANVTDSLEHHYTFFGHKKKKTVTVHYNAKYTAPYRFGRVYYISKDNNINSLLVADSANSLIIPGKNYDTDVLQAERERITYLLRNKGYFRFYKNYIYYLADSSGVGRSIDVYVGVNKVNENKNDSTGGEDHIVYHINKVSFATDYDPTAQRYTPSDTSYFDGYTFYRTTRKRVFKPRVIAQSNFIKPGDIYQAKNQEITYQRLGNLGVFRFTSIDFEDDTTKAGRTNHLLNCDIELTPLKFKSFNIETEGTNNGGNLGLSGNISVRNKNLFRGAEVLELKLKGGLEAQRTVADNVSERKTLYLFNTIQIGPEVSVIFPRFLLPFYVSNVNKNALPSTSITTGYNYQLRPEYKRSIINVSFNYNWRQGRYSRHIITAYEVNSVKLTDDDELKQRLKNINDALLLSSYRSHLITASRYTYIYNSQDANIFKPHVFFFTGNFEVAGTSLRTFNNLANSFKNETGAYRIAGLRYEQYVKMDADFRYYLNFITRNSLVVRVYGGIGVSYGNSSVMPFEKSFFGGGANDIRAWVIRRLGPGNVNKFDNVNTYNVDQLGDIKLESNLEYRFNVIRITSGITLQGATFVDAGNIWNRRYDASKPGAEFRSNRVYKDLYIGGGLGARLNLNFFILRLDYAVKLRDPSYLQNPWVGQHYFDKHWAQDNGYSFGVFNLGIGYPF